MQLLRGCVMLTWLLVGCSTAGDGLAAAHRLDHVTGYAHMVLRAGFEQTSATEDHLDHALLQQVATLDAADEALPAAVEQFDAAEDSAGRRVMQAEILRHLDAIAAGMQDVEDALQPRTSHAAVRDALDSVPETLAHLRRHVGGTAALD